MNKFFFFTFLLFILSCNNERQNVEHLIFKNKLAFKPDSEKPYTGKVFRLNRKGNIEFEGYLCKLPLFLDHFGLEFLGVFSNSRETD
jgi:hypothetical protein